MKKLLLVALLGFGVALAQNVQETPLMSALEGATEQQGAGLYSFSLSNQTPETRTYSSEFQTPEGELIPLNWQLRSREGERFLDSVQVSTVTDFGASEAAGYAMGFSWTSVQFYCFGLTDEQHEAVEAWIRERLASVPVVQDERRFIKQIGALEVLLELSPAGDGRSRFVITQSRSDSPGEANNGWAAYCVQEATP